MSAERKIMDSKTQEFYQQQGIREGKCIDCGEKVAVVNGIRTSCACDWGNNKPHTPREQAFASWFEEEIKKPRPR